MILVDSNIFIDYWKNPTEEWTSVFRQNDVAVCGVIQTELLRGSHSEKEFNQIKNALACFEYLSFSDNDWIEVSKLFVTLKKAGLSVPFQDGIIAYLADKNDCEIWTNDKHFNLIGTVIPKIKIRSN